MRVSHLSLPILFLAMILATPVATSSRDIRARTDSYANGKMVVVWGDPFGAMETAQGIGSESLSIRGNVTGREDLPGYFVYDATKLTGNLHSEWSVGADRYTLYADFVLVTSETPHMPTTIVPGADAFMVTGMDFAGTFTKNGETISAEGMGALVDAPRGLFGYNVQYRITAVLLYQSPLGAQFVICWSEKPQAIYGVESPAADHMRQKVLVT